MSQQQPNSTQIPQHRQQDVMEQNRLLREQVQQLQGTINQIYQRQLQAPPQPEKDDFEAPVAQAIERKVKSLLTPELTKVQQHVGYLVDENDHLKFVQKFGHETLEKYGDKIKQVREEANRMGRFATREEAYQRIYFDEHARKPAPTPEAPKGPQFDPYTGQWQQPQQTQPSATEAPAITAQQPPVPGPQKPQAPVNSPDPTVMPPQFQPPVQEPAFELPPAGPQNPQVAATSPRVQTSLDLMTDEKGLEAWEKKYGNLEL